MTREDLYEEVGSHSRADQWANAIHRDCSNCDASAGDRCVFPDGTLRKFPCVVRITGRSAAEVV